MLENQLTTVSALHTDVERSMNSYGKLLSNILCLGDIDIAGLTCAKVCSWETLPFDG